MEKNIITVGYHKGEMDFGVNCSIDNLTLKQMNELRIMTMVAIGQAERMWEQSRGTNAANEITPIVCLTGKT